jgi:hypothetical protein
LFADNVKVAEKHDMNNKTNNSWFIGLDNQATIKQYPRFQNDNGFSM